MVTLQYSVLQRKMFYAIGKIVHLTVTELRMFSACVTITECISGNVSVSWHQVLLTSSVSILMSSVIIYRMTTSLNLKKPGIRDR